MTLGNFDSDLDVLTPESTVNYGYSDENWKDKLTSYNGQNITYDSIGNPLEYLNGWTFDWKNGRQLDKMVNSGYNVNVSCKYDEGSVRTQKTVKSIKDGNEITKTTDFITDGIQILSQKTTTVVTDIATGNQVADPATDTIIWQIDGEGTVLGFIYNGEVYYYLKNAQGDIVGIADKDSNIVANYTYDSWGKLISITDESGTGRITDTDFIGYINPIRYRGYYYDSETGLYYLNARYYDPKTCRFINSDNNLEGGLNLFEYCYNNPIMFSDILGLSGILQIFAHPNHAWITYTDDKGNTKTIGTWGGGRIIKRGVNYGVEDYFIKKYGAYEGRVSLSANIDDVQEKSLFDFIAKNDKWEMFFNCSSFAVGAWEAAGQKTISNKALGIIPTPAALARNIKKVEGYQINAPTIPAIQKNPQKAHSSSNPLSIPYDSSYILGMYFDQKSYISMSLANVLFKFI